MKTKILMMIIFTMIIANAVNAQSISNPKLTNTHGSLNGHFLIVDYFDMIQSSDKTIYDFNKMQASIGNHDNQIKNQQETNDKQQERIRDQQEEILELKNENKEMKSNISQLERTINDLKRQLDELERVIRK